ncbi:MAG: tetratricopeptide repeat protein [Methanothrix sp.]|nr:tetratricopeptide repeat protein [Methanothrix sp.]
MEPEYATAWKNLAVACQSLHRLDEAEEAFRRAGELGL